MGYWNPVKFEAYQSHLFRNYVLHKFPDPFVLEFPTVIIGFHRFISHKSNLSDTIWWYLYQLPQPILCYLSLHWQDLRESTYQNQQHRTVFCMPFLEHILTCLYRSILVHTIFHWNFTDWHWSLWFIFQNSNNIICKSFHLTTMCNCHDTFISIAKNLRIQIKKRFSESIPFVRLTWMDFGIARRRSMIFEKP